MPEDILSLCSSNICFSFRCLLGSGYYWLHRPDKFPMDTVIFTGRVPVEELKEDRPRKYEELVKSGELEKLSAEPLPDYVIKSLKIFGAVALTIGITLIILIIYAEIFGYR